MSPLRVLICRVEEDAPDTLTELACGDLPATDLSALSAPTTLDFLEAESGGRAAKFGSGLVEKVQGLHWNLPAGEALATLKTLLLEGGMGTLLV